MGRSAGQVARRASTGWRFPCRVTRNGFKRCVNEPFKRPNIVKNHRRSNCRQRRRPSPSRKPVDDCCSSRRRSQAGNGVCLRASYSERPRPSAPVSYAKNRGQKQRSESTFCKYHPSKVHSDPCFPFRSRSSLGTTVRHHQAPRETGESTQKPGLNEPDPGFYGAVPAAIGAGAATTRFPPCSLAR